VFLAGHTVVMVIYCVTKINDNNVFTNSGQFFDTMIVASSDEEWL